MFFGGDVMKNIYLALLTVLWILPCLAEDSTGPKLFPKPQNAETGFLKVSDLHDIFYVVCGNPKGKPVMCLHGGPGVGSYPRLAQYFDPEKFRIVLHDQRGTGLKEE